VRVRVRVRVVATGDYSARLSVVDEVLAENRLNREEFEGKFSEYVDLYYDDLVSFLEGDDVGEIGKLLKRFRFDFNLLDGLSVGEQLGVLVDRVAKYNSYYDAVENNRGKGLEFVGFDDVELFFGVSEFVANAFDSRLLEECLISEVVYYDEIVNVNVGGSDFYLPSELYSEVVDAYPVVREVRYRAETFAGWNSLHDFSKKYFGTPILMYDSLNESISKSYLDGVADADRERLFGFGTLAHEIGHHVYEYLFDSEMRDVWRGLVDGNAALTEYIAQYDGDKLYSESFSEAVRLRTTVPEYFSDRFPELDVFLRENFFGIGGR